MRIRLRNVLFASFFTLLLAGQFFFSRELRGQETSGPVDWKVFCQENEDRVAYGVYLNGQKLGWLIEDFRLGDHQGNEAALYRIEAQMKLMFLEESFELKSVSNFVYRLDGDGSLIFAEEISVEDGEESRSTAVANGEGFQVEVDLEGTRTTFQTGPSKDNLAHLREFLTWIRGARKPGDEFAQSNLDFAKIAESDRSDSEIDPDGVEENRYVKKAKTRVGGVETEVQHIMVTMEGAEFEARALTDGTMLSGKIGPFEVRLEEEKIAKQLETVTMNSIAVIPVETDLGNPGNVKSLKLKIGGLSFYDWPESDRQKIVSVDKEKGEVILQLTSELDKSVKHELSDEDRRKYTASTANIQADHPEIVAMAEKLTKDKAGVMEKVSAMNGWVYRNLSFDMSDNSATALRVLRSRQGDCTEHALLLVALARALDIPAREVGGYTYTDEQSAFWAHAWTQIYNGTRWIDVDPAWDEVGINATHILSTIIDKPMAEIGFFGNLEIEVLDFETGEAKSPLSRLLDLLGE